MNDFFIKEIIEKGIILYEAPHNEMDHQKAEGDFHSAQREYRARKNPNMTLCVFILSNA